MPLTIIVINQNPLGEIDPQVLRQELLKVHIETLCNQYGLDPALIAPTIEKLAVVAVKGAISPYFLVRYRTDQQPPIIVHQWQIEKGALFGQLGDLPIENLVGELNWGRFADPYVINILLTPSHLEDLGLILGYELARWVAGQGKGLVRGLDGVWYRLNNHQAFISLADE